MLPGGLTRSNLAMTDRLPTPKPTLIPGNANAFDMVLTTSRLENRSRQPTTDRPTNSK